MADWREAPAAASEASERGAPRARAKAATIVKDEDDDATLAERRDEDRPATATRHQDDPTRILVGPRVNCPGGKLSTMRADASVFVPSSLLRPHEGESDAGDAATPRRKAKAAAAASIVAEVEDEVTSHRCRRHRGRGRGADSGRSVNADTRCGRNRRDCTTYRPTRSTGGAADIGSRDQSFPSRPASSKARKDSARRRRRRRQANKGRIIAPKCGDDAEATDSIVSANRNECKRNTNTDKRMTRRGRRRKTREDMVQDSSATPRSQTKEKDNADSIAEEGTLGLEMHFPSLVDGTENARSNRGMNEDALESSKGTITTSMWSQVAAKPLENGIDNEHCGGDELQELIRSGDLTRLASSLPAHRKKRTVRVAWSDDDDDGDENGTSVGSDADDADGKSRVIDQSPSLMSQSTKPSSRDMSRLRERWWAALRERKARGRETREAKMALLAANSSDSSASSSCSSVSTLESSSSISAGDMEMPKDRRPVRSTSLVLTLQMQDDARAVNVSKYLDEPYPVHLAVLKGDAAALNCLLTLPIDMTRCDAFVDEENLAGKFSMRPHGNSTIALRSFSAIHLATYLNKSDLLRILLDKGVPSSALSVDARDDLGQTPLMLACQHNYEASVRVLLSFGPRLLLKERSRGDTVLHACCRGAETSTLRLILGATCRGNSQQRFICARNDAGKTPLHLACEEGRTSLVEAFLSTAPSATARALKIQDSEGRQPLLAAVASGATDVVVDLIMWRGNNVEQGRCKQGRKYQNTYSGTALGITSNESQSAPSFPSFSCPLTEAVSTGSYEMVRLLLEFGGPSVSTSCVKYDVTGALMAALSLQPSHLDRGEIVALLVEAGADPYSSFNESSPSSRNSLSAISVAAYKGDAALDIMLKVSNQVIREKRSGRRQDPLLQKHYRVIESRETGAIDAALQDTLVQSLFCGRSCCDANRLRSCLSLYRNGTKLSDSSYCRLQTSLATGKLFSAKNVPTHHDVSFETHYSHPIGVGKFYWSEQLLRLGWFWDTSNVISDADINCPWIKEKIHRRPPNLIESNNLPSDADVCFLIIDGQRFVAHRAILSNKSAKLDAAIRFASQTSTEGTIELQVDAPLMLMKLFLQHCYHGSIAIGLPLEPRRRCNTLMRLVFLADEFLCPSLLLEVEMRLLASSLDCCFCISCCKTVAQRIDGPENEATINCQCQVSGKSRLITKETSIDVLAMARDASILSADYAVRAFASDSSSGCYSLGPFGAVSSAAARCVLQDFESVRRTNTIDLANDEDFSIALLEACLDAASARSASEVSSLEFKGTRQDFLNEKNATKYHK